MISKCDGHADGEHLAMPDGRQRALLNYEREALTRFHGGKAQQEPQSTGKAKSEGKRQWRGDESGKGMRTGREQFHRAQSVDAEGRERGTQPTMRRSRSTVNWEDQGYWEGKYDEYHQDFFTGPREADQPSRTLRQQRDPAEYEDEYRTVERRDHFSYRGDYGRPREEESRRWEDDRSKGKGDRYRRDRDEDVRQCKGKGDWDRRGREEFSQRESKGKGKQEPRWETPRMGPVSREEWERQQDPFAPPTSSKGMGGKEAIEWWKPSASSKGPAKGKGYSQWTAEGAQVWGGRGPTRERTPGPGWTVQPPPGKGNTYAGTAGQEKPLNRRIEGAETVILESDDEKTPKWSRVTTTWGSEPEPVKGPTSAGPSGSAERPVVVDLLDEDQSFSGLHPPTSESELDEKDHYRDQYKYLNRRKGKKMGKRLLRTDADWEKFGKAAKDMNEYEKQLKNKIMVIYDEEEVVFSGKNYPREAYVCAVTGEDQWWHVHPPAKWEETTPQDRTSFQTTGYRMTGITWEPIMTSKTAAVKNGEELNKELVAFLMKLRESWGYPSDYPLVVAHKGGREEDKFWKLNEENEGLNVRPVDLAEIDTDFPTFNQFVGHKKMDKKGNFKAGKPRLKGWTEDDKVRAFLMEHYCGVYHGDQTEVDIEQEPYHREWDTTYMVSCINVNTNIPYRTPWRLHPVLHLHCPKAEVHFFWHFTRERLGNRIFYYEGYKAEPKTHTKAPEAGGPTAQLGPSASEAASSSSSVVSPKGKEKETPEIPSREGEERSGASEGIQPPADPQAEEIRAELQAMDVDAEESIVANIAEDEPGVRGGPECGGPQEEGHSATPGPATLRPFPTSLAGDDPPMVARLKRAEREAQEAMRREGPRIDTREEWEAKQRVRREYYNYPNPPPPTPRYPRFTLLPSLKGTSPDMRGHPHGHASSAVQAPTHRSEGETSGTRATFGTAKVGPSQSQSSPLFPRGTHLPSRSTGESTEGASSSSSSSGAPSRATACPTEVHGVQGQQGRSPSSERRVHFEGAVPSQVSQPSPGPPLDPCTRFDASISLQGEPIRAELDTVFRKMGQRRLPSREEYEQDPTRYVDMGIGDLSHLKKLKSAFENRKTQERKVRVAVQAAINGEECGIVGSAVRSITEGICAHMGITPKWTDKHMTHERPEETGESEPKRAKTEIGLVSVAVEVREGSLEPVHKEDKEATPTDPPADSGASGAIVHPTSNAGMCFRGASLCAGGTQLNLRCRDGDAETVLIRERKLLAAMFTRHGNFEAVVQCKEDHQKPRGFHAHDRLWEVLITGRTDGPKLTVGVSIYERSGQLDFYIQGSSELISQVLRFYGLRRLAPGQAIEWD